MSKQQAVEEVVQFLKGLTFADSTPGVDGPWTLFSDYRFGTVVLSGDQYSGYKSCLDAVERAFEKQSTFSRKGLEWVLKQAILRATGENGFEGRLSPEQLQRARLWLEKQLAASSQRFISFTPVQGFDPKSLPRSFGGIQFLPNNQDVRDRMKSIIMQTDRTSPVPNSEGAAALGGMVDRHYVSGAIAKVSVVAGDSQNAIDKAVTQCRRTLDVLNFFFGRPLRGRGEFNVSIAGEGNECPSPDRIDPSSKPNFLAVLAADGEEGVQFEGVNIRGWQLDPNNGGPHIGLHLPDLSGRVASDSFGQALLRASDMLAKEAKVRTKWEDRVLAAIQWAGRAASCVRQEEAFLLYMIAFESLLMGDNVNSEITYQLRVRSAHFLRRDLKSRKDIVARIASIYKTRSKIVHSGKYDVNQGQVEEASRCASQAIMYALVAEPFSDMTDPKQFEDWLSDQILLGPEDN